MEKNSATLVHDKDEFSIQTLADTLHSGLGCYAPHYLTRKLPFGYSGFAVACLNIVEDKWQYSEDLIKVLFFDKDCYQVKNLAEITDKVVEKP